MLAPVVHSRVAVGLLVAPLVVLLRGVEELRLMEGLMVLLQGLVDYLQVVVLFLEQQALLLLCGNIL